MKRIEVICRSGIQGHRVKLQGNYRNFREFKAYSDTYSLHERLGYSTASQAWHDNPTIEHSTVPSDFRRFRATDLWLYECGICSCYHPWNWFGDCRDDANRYATPEDFFEQTGISEFGLDGKLQVQIFSWQDRMESDGWELDTVDEG